MWRDKKIKIYCDNVAVVNAVNSGKARDSILVACARNIWNATFDIDLVVHLRGQENSVAGLLSRWTYTHRDTQTHVRMNTHLDLLLLNYDI